MNKHKASELAKDVSCVETRGKWDAAILHQAAAELRAMHDREQRQHALIVQMQEALQALLNEQNGAPLVKYEKEWNEAIRLSRAATASANEYLGEQA